MYFEQHIIRNNTQIASNQYSPNQNRALYFQSHKRDIASGEEDIIINNLTLEEIEEIRSLCESKMEKKSLKIFKVEIQLIY